MKKLFNLAFAVLFMTFFCQAGCEKEIMITEQELPEPAKQFLTTHFSGENITKVIKDKEGSSTTFEVTVANGSDVDFDNDGKCISMDGHGQRLPDSALSSNIVTYIQTHYQNNMITDWGIESFGQKVELSGDIELGFDNEGNFIRIL